MNITIDGKTFTFDDQSIFKTESGGYDLYIEEPGFNKTSEELQEQFTSKQIVIPEQIERLVNRNSTELPCSKIYQDSVGKKRLYTYFD